MLRGIRFEVPNDWGTILLRIFQGVDLSAATLYVSETEAYQNNKGDPLFDRGEYAFSEFLERLQIHSYVYFLTVRAFPKAQKYVEVRNYEEFLGSSCLFVMLVCDTVFVDVYAKDRELIKTIWKNAEESGFDKIAFLTGENDIYTEFEY